MQYLIIVVPVHLLRPPEPPKKGQVIEAREWEVLADGKAVEKPAAA